MLTITNGKTILTVTKGAYESMYAPQGWEIRSDETGSKNDDLRGISGNKEITLPESESPVFDPKSEQPDDGDDELESDEVDLSEIPLSEMSVPQLKSYAKQLGVEVNTDSARQLRSQIKKVLER